MCEKMESKCNDRASECRNAGNKCYSERHFFDALVKYNESLCRAVDGSHAVGLAYANRSAVFFEMKMYTNCLQNIELAKSRGYPEENSLILERRREKCVALMNRNVDSHQQMTENSSCFAKLSHKANARMPFIVDCLELRMNDEFGRYVVTARDLKVGDVVSIEDPFFRVIKSDSRYESCQESNKYQRCAVCLRDNLMDLIPCSRCCSSKVFLF
jgi:hypothetical protein